MHGANFGHHPAHALQRGVVVTDLNAAAHEVLLLKDDHAAALVGLQRRQRRFNGIPEAVRAAGHSGVRVLGTHSAVNGAQRHEALHVVGEGTTVSVPVGVLSSLQDELLALEVMVLETDPATERQRQREGPVLHDDLQTFVCFCDLTSK